MNIDTGIVNVHGFRGSMFKGLKAGIARLVSEETRRETLLKARDVKKVIHFITEMEAKNESS